MARVLIAMQIRHNVFGAAQLKHVRMLDKAIVPAIKRQQHVLVIHTGHAVAALPNHNVHGVATITLARVWMRGQINVREQFTQIRRVAISLANAILSVLMEVNVSVLNVNVLRDSMVQIVQKQKTVWVSSTERQLMIFVVCVMETEPNVWDVTANRTVSTFTMPVECAAVTGWSVITPAMPPTAVPASLIQRSVRGVLSNKNAFICFVMRHVSIRMNLVLVSRPAHLSC
jgi:hypothetical protein